MSWAVAVNCSTDPAPTVAVFGEVAMPVGVECTTVRCMVFERMFE